MAGFSFTVDRTTNTASLNQSRLKAIDKEDVFIRINNRCNLFANCQQGTVYLISGLLQCHTFGGLQTVSLEWEGVWRQTVGMMEPP